MSSVDLVRFLERHPPFMDLGEAGLAGLVSRIRVEDYPSDTVVLRQSGEPAQALFVVRRGTVDLYDEGCLVERLGVGDVFGLSVLSGLAPALTAIARAGSQCIAIDAHPAREILGTTPGLAFLAASVTRWRERDAAERHVRRAGVDDALVASIASARDAAALVDAAGLLAPTVRSLLDQGVDPIDIGHVVGVAIDHLTVRAIELRIAEAGETPAPFAWIALGSAARHEQALLTDQDHAIAYGPHDEAADVESYFGGLATAVTDTLASCGIARCRGNVMAENPAWRRTVDDWRRAFVRYVADPELMGTRVSSIAFDYRRIVGAVDVESVLDAVIRASRSDRGFLRRLMRVAVEQRPPIGRFREIVVERRGANRGSIDVKHGGIMIVTNLARLFAIEAGISENRTIERLRGAAAAGAIPERTRDALTEAFQVLWRVRLAHQAHQLEHGAPPDDFVPLADLSVVTRRALAGAFHAIAVEQRAVTGRLRGKG